MNACIMNTSNHTQMTIAGKSLVSVNFTIDQSSFIKEVHKYACSAKNKCRCLQDFEAFAVLTSHICCYFWEQSHILTVRNRSEIGLGQKHQLERPQTSDFALGKR